MALPDSRMSLVTAIHSRVFLRRVEEALKTSPDFNCLPSSSQMTAPRFNPQSVSFGKRDGAVECVVRLIGRAVLFVLLPADLALYLAVKVVATSDGDDGLETVLSFEYVGFELRLVDSNQVETPLELGDELYAEIEAGIAVSLAGTLAELAVPLDVSSLLASGAAISTSPVVTIGELDGAGTSDTLFVGLEVDGDTGVDRQFFRNEFEPESLGDRDWSAEIDERLFTATVQEHLDDVELEGEVPNWADTDRVTAFWSESSAPEPDYGQAENIAAVSSQHPIWTIIEGDYTVFGGWGELVGTIEMGAWAVVFADLMVADGQILAQPGLFRAGYGLLPIDVAEADIDPTVIRDSDQFGHGLRLEGFAYDAQRLVVLGADDHDGMPGMPDVVPPEMAKVTLDWQTVGTGMCSGWMAVGLLTEDGAVLSKPAFGNTGTAPLWVCEAEIVDDDAGVFSVVGPDLPLRIDPGELGRISIAMAVDDGDTAEYTATLRVRLNVLDRPFVDVPIHGHRDATPAPTVGTEMCLRQPELIPPQDWFTTVVGWLGDPDQILTHQPDPMDVLVVVLAGLPAESVVLASGADGATTDVAVGVNGSHSLVIPATGARIDVMAPGRRTAEKFAGGWIRTARHTAVTEWSTRERIVAFTAGRTTAAVLTPAGVTLIPLNGGAARPVGEVQIEDGRDVVAVGDSFVVLTGSEVISIGADLRPEATALRGYDRLVAVRGGALAVGRDTVGMVERGRGGVEVAERKLPGAGVGAVPVSGGIVVVGDDRALLIGGSGLAGLARANEKPLAELEPHVGIWLKVGAPDVARRVAERRFAVMEQERGVRTLGTLGPSKLTFRPPTLR